MRLRRFLIAAGMGLCAPQLCAHHVNEPLPPLDYVAAAPGAYRLQRIMVAPDGRILDVRGRTQRLARFTRDKVTLLGFIYTTCVDPHGCPLAYRVFDSLKSSIQSNAGLHGKVRFVTLSFDPARDTPSVMTRYAGSRLQEEKGLDWYFLTTRSVQDLLPIIEGYGQDVRYAVDKSSGKPVRELSHVLKVFLIDRVGYVREIYSSTFLHPQTVMNDIKTLLIEHSEARSGDGLTH